MADPEHPSLWLTISRNAPRVLAIAAVAGLLWTPFTLLTGGFRSQMQIDVETLKATVSDLTAKTAVLNSRLDALPRSTDYSGWEAHLSRLDANLDAIRDAIAQDRLVNKETAVRLQNLTSVPAQGPRR